MSRQVGKKGRKRISSNLYKYFQQTLRRDDQDCTPSRYPDDDW